MATEQLQYAYETAGMLPSETLEEDVRQNIQEGRIVEGKPGESLDALLQS